MRRHPPQSVVKPVCAAGVWLARPDMNSQITRNICQLWRNGHGAESRSKQEAGLHGRTLQDHTGEDATRTVDKPTTPSGHPCSLADQSHPASANCPSKGPRYFVKSIVHDAAWHARPLLACKTRLPMFDIFASAGAGELTQLPIPRCQISFSISRSIWVHGSYETPPFGKLRSVFPVA